MAPAVRSDFVLIFFSAFLWKELNELHISFVRVSLLNMEAKQVCYANCESIFYFRKKNFVSYLYINVLN